jgi:hypothetical protein
VANFFLRKRPGPPAPVGDALVEAFSQLLAFAAMGAGALVFLGWLGTLVLRLLAALIGL